MDSFIQTFHIDWKILIAQAVNFGIVFAVLWLFAYKPVKKLMKERSDKIARGVNDAKQNKELLEKTQKAYDDVLAKARIESNEIFQQGKQEAEKNKAVIIESAQEEVAIMIKNGKKSLDAEKEKMLDQVKKEIISLVVKATEKLLETNSNDSFDEKTINKIKKL